MEPILPTMQALHLPGVSKSERPQFEFPDHPPPPSSLQYSSKFPLPDVPASLTQTAYLISVQYTALTRGELSWKEVLDISRFRTYGSAIPGHDVVGVVTTVFSPTTTPAVRPKFKEGDQVWGLIDFDRDGAASGTTFAYESELSLAPISASTNSSSWLEMLATLPLSGLTANQALHDHAKSALPQDRNARILVTGATGSVGILVVQLAKAWGHQVIALASKRKADFLSKFVDTVIPYDDPSFTSLPEYMKAHAIPPADVVIDCVGGATFKSIQSLPGALREGGKAITIVEYTAPNFFIVKPDGGQLDELGKLITGGNLVGYVAGAYALSAGREAMETVESKHGMTGRIVLRVAADR